MEEEREDSGAALELSAVKIVDSDVSSGTPPLISSRARSLSGPNLKALAFDDSISASTNKPKRGASTFEVKP